MTEPERKPVVEKVQMFLPRPFHATIKVDKDEVILTPVGVRRGIMSIADIVTYDSAGNELRHQVLYSRKTGKLKTQRVDDTGKPVEDSSGKT